MTLREFAKPLFEAGARLAELHKEQQECQQTVRKYHNELDALLRSHPEWPRRTNGDWCEEVWDMEISYEDQRL